MSICLILPYEQADGAANMALDEAILEQVAADPTFAILRTYGWVKPTLSLGYFQTKADVDKDPRWTGAPLVRRPTGGGALWHDQEVTYAIVIPRSHPLSRNVGDLYRVVHTCIAELLAAHGVRASRRGASEKLETKPFLCFADRDENDVVAGDASVKLVGSAQRRRAGAVLQHGSLLLGRSATTPELAGAADLGVIETGLAYWSERLAQAIPWAIGCESRRSLVGEGLRGRAARLAEEVYQSRDWTEKR